jgi:hypothetical protein
MMGEKFVMNVERKKKMDNDIYEDLSDGEILDMIFDRFDIDQSNFQPIFRPTEELFKKIDKLLEVTNG